MNKELKALKRIVSEVSISKLQGVGDENWLGVQDVFQDIATIVNALERNKGVK